MRWPGEALSTLRRHGAAVWIGVFALLVVSGLHGFSIHSWSAHTGDRERSGLLVGAPHDLRSDDWCVELPLAWAQHSHSPRFPAVNDLIGEGQPMSLSPVKAPTLSAITLFRPQLWGWFAGPDTGLAWQWWFLVLGPPVGCYALLRSFSCTRTSAAAAAAAMAGSPFLNLWAFHYSDTFAAAALTIAGMRRAAASRGPAPLALYAGTAWSAGWFALALYPPFQIGFLWLSAALAGAGLVVARRRGSPILGGVLRAGLPVAAAACAVGVILWNERDVLDRMASTVYPGLREEAGGGLPLYRIYGPGALLHLLCERWHYFGNACDTAGFIPLAPFSVPLVLLGWRRIDRRIAPAIAALILLLAAAYAYWRLGFPKWLASGTLLSHVPARRLLFAIGAADLLLAALVAGVAFRRSRESPAGPVARIAVTVFGTAVFQYMISRFEVATGEDLLAARIATFAWCVPAGWALTSPSERWRAAGPALVAVVGAVTTVGVNPLVRGGTESITGSPVAAALREAVRTSPADARIAVYGETPLMNLPRILGLPCVNGSHPVPDFELWSILDPDGTSVRAWNRYGHVRLVATPSRPGAVEIGAPKFDLVICAIRPDHPALERLRVGVLLAVGPDTAVLRAEPGLAEAWTDGVVSIFRRK